MSHKKQVLFMDIDGVLATMCQYLTSPRTYHKEYNCYRFDDKCVKVLNSIIDNLSDPIIVLSSDWKVHYTLEQMNEIFKWNGVNKEISDFTMSAWGVEFKSYQQLEECRSYEILNYVERHQLTNWVAIDDLSLRKWIPDNFVHTTEKEGIKQSGIKLKILNKLNNTKY
jgi:hypothetical protein